MKRRRIGIYPGTFDPIHSGHIAFAEAALQVCGLDEIIFLPEQEPRGKHGVTDMAHRIALMQQACKATSRLSVATLHSRQFTVQQTLPELREMFSSSDLTLLVGSDIVRTFTYRWEGLETLLKEVSLAIGMRAGESTNEVAAIMDQLSEKYMTSIQYVIISTPESAVSSSQIRSGDRHALHPETHAYIKQHQLYKSVDSPQ